MNGLDRNELKRILADEEELQPMTGFSTRVMRAVREEATTTAPLAFPWARFLPGFLLNLVLLVGAAIWVLLQPGSTSPGPLFPTEWFSDPQVQGLLWALGTVVTTGVLAWATSSWATPRRATSF